MTSNPYYGHWHFGQVIDDVSHDLGPALALASETHPQFLSAQRARFAYTFHEDPASTAAEYGTGAIADFLAAVVGYNSMSPHFGYDSGHQLGHRLSVFTVQAGRTRGPRKGRTVLDATVQSGMIDGALQRIQWNVPGSSVIASYCKPVGGTKPRLPGPDWT